MRDYLTDIQNTRDILTSCDYRIEEMSHISIILNDLRVKLTMLLRSILVGILMILRMLILLY